MKVLRFGSIFLIAMALAACPWFGDPGEDPGSAESAPLLSGDEHYAFSTVTEWLIVDALLSADLLLVDSSALTVATAPGTSLVAGGAYSVIASGSAATGRNLSVHEDWDDGASLPAGKYGLRFYNTLGGSVFLHEPIDLAGLLNPGDFSPFESLTFGTESTGLFVLADGATGAETVIDAADEPASAAADVVLLTDPVDSSVYAQWLELAPPVDLDTTGAAIRVVSASVSQPAVDVDFPGSDDDVDDLAYGQATAENTAEFYVAVIGDGLASDIPVTVSWTAGTPINHTVQDAARGDVYTLILWDSTPGNPEILELEGAGIPDGGTDIAVRITNVSDTQASYIQQSPDALAAVPAGLVSPPGPGAIERDAGESRFIVQSDDKRVLTDIQVTADGEILSLFAVPHESDGLRTIGVVRDAPDTSPLGDQFALVRFVNASLPQAPLRVDVSGE